MTAVGCEQRQRESELARPDVRDASYRRAAAALGIDVRAFQQQRTEAERDRGQIDGDVERGVERFVLVA